MLFGLSRSVFAFLLTFSPNYLEVMQKLAIFAAINLKKTKQWNHNYHKL